MTKKDSVSLNEQVAFIQETEGRLFHRWRMLWERSQSGRHNDPLKLLTSSQFHTVMVVHHENEVTISRLAELQGVSKPSASVKVERLVAKGALVRQLDPKDRRRVIIRVSPEYEAYLDESIQSMRRHRTTLARQIGPGFVRKWYDAMKRVREVFEAEQDGGDRPPGASGR